MTNKNKEIILETGSGLDETYSNLFESFDKVQIIHKALKKPYVDTKEKVELETFLNQDSYVLDSEFNRVWNENRDTSRSATSGVETLLEDFYTNVMRQIKGYERLLLPEFEKVKDKKTVIKPNYDIIKDVKNVFDAYEGIRRFKQLHEKGLNVKNYHNKLIRKVSDYDNSQLIDFIKSIPDYSKDTTQDLSVVKMKEFIKKSKIDIQNPTYEQLEKIHNEDIRIRNEALAKANEEEYKQEFPLMKISKNVELLKSWGATPFIKVHDVVNEGIKQNHCIGNKNMGYRDKMLKARAVAFNYKKVTYFVSNLTSSTPSISAYGYGNSSPKDKDEQFIRSKVNNEKFELLKEKDYNKLQNENA